MLGGAAAAGGRKLKQETSMQVSHISQTQKSPPGRDSMINTRDHNKSKISCVWYAKLGIAKLVWTVNIVLLLPARLS